jgi:MacB-like periplasmic core domain
MFSVADAFLLKPIALPDLGRLVMVMERRPGQTQEWSNVAPANYLDWKRQSRSFEDLAPCRWDELNLTGSGEPERLQVVRAGGNFFDLLGAKAMLGRTFLQEDAQGSRTLAVLSYGLWTRRFGSDPSIVGKTIKLDGLSHTVIGVMSKKFNFPVSAELWIPMALDPKEGAVFGPITI